MRAPAGKATKTVAQTVSAWCGYEK